VNAKDLLRSGVSGLMNSPAREGMRTHRFVLKSKSSLRRKSKGRVVRGNPFARGLTGG
jgi:hypothetical protein